MCVPGMRGLGNTNGEDPGPSSARQRIRVSPRDPAALKLRRDKSDRLKQLRKKLFPNTEAETRGEESATRSANENAASNLRGTHCTESVCCPD